MNNAVAMQSREYLPILCPSEYKRNRTSECEGNALNVLGDYKYWGQITKKEYEYFVKEIKAAPHNDAIADIMTKLRKRIYN